MMTTAECHVQGEQISDFGDLSRPILNGREFDWQS